MIWINPMPRRRRESPTFLDEQVCLVIPADELVRRRAERVARLAAEQQRNAAATKTEEEPA
jgi:hypothetical protein